MSKSIENLLYGGGVASSTILSFPLEYAVRMREHLSSQETWAFLFMGSLYAANLALYGTPLVKNIFQQKRIKSVGTTTETVVSENNLGTDATTLENLKSCSHRLAVQMQQIIKKNLDVLPKINVDMLLHQSVGSACDLITCENNALKQQSKIERANIVFGLVDQLVKDNNLSQEAIADTDSKKIKAMQKIDLLLSQKPMVEQKKPYMGCTFQSSSIEMMPLLLDMPRQDFDTFIDLVKQDKLPEALLVDNAKRADFIFNYKAAEQKRNASWKLRRNKQLNSLDIALNSIIKKTDYN